MKKIKAVSRIFKIFFQIALYVTPIFVIAGWLTNGYLFQFVHLQLHSFPSLPPVAALPTIAKFYAFLVTLIPMTTLMFVLYFSRRLFSTYEMEKIFEIENAHCIRNIGITIFIWQLIWPLYDLLISYTFTYSTGNPQWKINFTATDIGEIVIGALLVVIGWIMVEASKLKKEQEYTI